MTEGAYVGSFEAVRDFRAALHTFLQEVREAMCSNDLEVRRTLEWLLEAQPRHWHQQVRNCEEAVVAAKIELERCRSSSLPGGGTPSCMEEKKALERARQRCRWAEEKVESVRKWGYVVGREAEEYTGRANQLAGLFDADLPQAIAMLDRVLNALESYAALSVQGAAPSAAISPGSRPVAAEPATEVPGTDEAPQAACEEAGEESAPRRSVS
jgi:hypothetical protein